MSRRPVGVAAARARGVGTVRRGPEREATSRRIAPGSDISRTAATMTSKLVDNMETGNGYQGASGGYQADAGGGTNGEMRNIFVESNSDTFNESKLKRLS